MNASAQEGPAPILVALGSEARTLRLLHAGFRMAREQGRPWAAVHIEVPGWETAEEADQARVWLREAQDLGAEAVWVRSSTVANGLAAELKRTAAGTLLVGQSRGRSPLARLEQARIHERLKTQFSLQIVTLPLEDAAPAGHEPVRTLADAAGVLAASSVLLVVSTIAASALAVVAGPPAIPGTFSATVAFIAHRWGRRAAIPAIALSLLAYLYLFAEPRFSFAFSSGRDLFYFVGTLSVVHLLVDLVDRLRLETRTTRRREAETVLLMLLGRALARCSTVPEAAEVLSQRLPGLHRAEAWLLVPADGDAWACHPPVGEPLPPPSDLLPRSGRTSREDPLEPVFRDGCTYVALTSTRGTEGLLRIRRAGGEPFPPDAWDSLQAFAVQGALALERIHWLETARRAHVERETERMRSSLLSAISHDLRTPLAAIQGAASSLLLPAEPLPESTRRDMLTMIHDESDRLAQLLSNLLDLTRLESGVLRARKEWQPLDEVVGAVLRRLGSGTEVRVELPSDLPLVPLDAALAEQLLANLLANAGRHAPGHPVTFRAWLGDGSLELAVTDRGPGIPEAYRERIFDKFFRMPGAGDGGVGLGLAICEAIAKTHGGRIWAEDAPEGGASFRISLPMEGEPPTLPPET